MFHMEVLVQLRVLFVMLPLSKWRRNVKNSGLRHNGAQSQAERPRENKGNTSRRKSGNWRNNQITLSIYPC
jgi:hypothetical protein